MYTWKTTPRLSLAIALVTIISSSGDAKGQILDDKIEDAIEFSLFNDPYAEPNDTDVAVKDGVATLTGSVSSIGAKNRAATITETRRGVRTVVNLIQVDPRPVANGELKERIERGLHWDPVGKRQDITVAVSEGSVSLRGQARSLGAKREVARLVAGIRGVKDVRNNVEVDFGADRADPEIKAHVVKRWRWHTYVDPDELRLEVTGGKVEISGKIGSAAQRREVVGLAEVAGVKEIDATSLLIEPEIQDDSQKTKANLARSDSEIADAIKDGWAHDPRIYAFEPQLEVLRGFVRLHGTVNTLAAKNAAVQVARNTPGAKLVHNFLKVRPKEPKRTDVSITDEIRRALVEDPGTDAYEVGVQVRNGNVTLRGEVEEQWEKMRANVVVAGVTGVKTIKNWLEVEDGFLGFSDDSDPYPPVDNGLLPIDDEALLRRIEHELHWDARFQDAKISVTVDQRSATLRGNAPNPSVKHDAFEAAMMAGASGVTNRIEIFPDLESATP